MSKMGLLGLKSLKRSKNNYSTPDLRTRRSDEEPPESPTYGVETLYLSRPRTPHDASPPKETYVYAPQYSQQQQQPKTRNNYANKSKKRPPHHQGSRSYDVESNLQTTPLYRQTFDLSSTSHYSKSRSTHNMNDGRNSYEATASIDDPRRYYTPPPLPAETPPSQSPNFGRRQRTLPESNTNSDERNYSGSGGDTPTGRPRQSSTSGSSAYTGYVDGDPSSPSSYNHHSNVPPHPTSSAPTSGAPNNEPLTRVRSNDPYIPPSNSNQAQAPRKRTISSPLAQDQSQNRSPRSKPPPNLPANIATPKYSPAFMAPYSSPPGGIVFPGAYPSPTTATNSNFVPASPVNMTAPYSAGYGSSFPDNRGGPSVQYAPMSKPPLRTNEQGPTSIVAPGRQQTRRPTIAQTHACMSLHRMDKLLLIKFPASAVAAVKSAIERSWPKGFQSEKEVPGSTDFQLRGNPWSGQGEDAIPAVYMMCETMSSLYHLGWNLIMSTDISKKAMDKDTLVYKQGEIPSPCNFMAVSFQDGDKLRLIRPPNDVINAVKAIWGGGIQKESWKLPNVAWEFKLSGSPWWSSGDESIVVRIQLLNMLDAFSQLGWDLHASIDMTAGPGGLGKNAGSDTDCWILRKRAN